MSGTIYRVISIGKAVAFMAIFILHQCTYIMRKNNLPLLKHPKEMGLL